MNHIISKSIIFTFALLILPSLSFTEQPKLDIDIYYEETMFWDYFSARGRGSLIVYNPAQLDSLIYANMDLHNIPGVALSIIKDSQIVYLNNYGYANLENFEPVNHQTLFITASISKTFVANAAMKLWEDGLLDLDIDINTYMPFNVINPNYPEEPITMRMLLCHTSSIDSKNENWWLDTVYGEDYPGDLGDYLENYLDPSGAAYAVENYLNQPPGTYYVYCNYAFALAGYIIERIAINNGVSSSLEEFCQDSLFMPLGMDQTSWFLANLDTFNIAMPYGFDGSDYFPYGHHGIPLYPAGQLRTSTLQLSNHLITFMNHGSFNGTRILDSATVAHMMTEQYPAANPNPEQFVQGIGWRHSFDSDAGWSVWGHSGSLSGCKTFMYFDSTDRTGLCLLTNSTDNWTGAGEIYWAIFEFMKDADMDGIIAGLDNCPYVANLEQLDIDGDEIGDACDNCPETCNPGQTDTDDNGVGDACQYVCGDANGDGMVNVGDAVFLIAYVFSGGSPPNPECEGDANGDSGTNVGDAVHLISYVFKGGPAPVEPCCL